MKKYSILATAALMLQAFSLRAEESKIKEIRSIYNAISEKIEHEELLDHEIAFRTLVPGIGRQHTTMRFYYEFLQDGETGEILESPLLKVTIDYMIAASVSIHIEYVFNEAEEVVFFYLRAEGAECGEKRFYFDKEKPIKIKINSLGDECIETEAGYIYESYERTNDFSVEDHARAKEIVKKASSYTKFFDEMQRMEQSDK